MPSGNLEVVGNQIEAGLWFCISIVMLVKRFQAVPSLKSTFTIMACAYFVFGISDLIESQTGAWWRPWWLLVLKGCCMIVIAIGSYHSIRQTDATRSIHGKETTDT